MTIKWWFLTQNEAETQERGKLYNFTKELEKETHKQLATAFQTR